MTDRLDGLLEAARAYGALRARRHRLARRAWFGVGLAAGVAVSSAARFARTLR